MIMQRLLTNNASAFMAMEECVAYLRKYMRLSYCLHCFFMWKRKENMKLNNNHENSCDSITDQPLLFSYLIITYFNFFGSL